MDKAEKIKAARKKLKEFQSQNKKPDATPGENEEVIIKHQEQPAIASFFDTISSDTNPFNQDVSSGAHQYFTTASSPSPFQEIQQTNVFASEIQQTMPPISDVQYAATMPSLVPEKQIINYFQQQQQQPQNDEKIDDFQMQISQLKSEVEFHRMTATNLQKNVDELNRFRQQEQHQQEAIKLLVKEKTHLADAFQKSENIIATLKGETEELHNRLNLSRYRVKQLESMASIVSPNNNVLQEIDPRKVEEMVEERIKEFRKSLEVNESEKNELKLLLHQKRIEMENLQKNYDHLSTELHRQSIKIAQLSDGAQPEGADQAAHQSHIAALSQDSAIKQQQMNELNSLIDQLNREKEASETQYQNYVSAMTREMDLLKEGSIELSTENNALTKREQELLKHVSDLERQIQQQNNKQKIYAENQQSTSVEEKTSSQDVQKWTIQVEKLTAENETLKARLTQYESDKIEMNKKYELTAEEFRSLQLQLERLTTETPNVSQLMVDFEDKSTAASRALIQNQSLKDQLEELQRAFVNISNDKMELTDKLQSELHLCKEMKSLHDAMEAELSTIKDKWQFKEDEMIRLSHSNTELEKKILQQNIEIDRLRHYESKDYHRGEGGILESELENCRHLIESLTNKINVLESQKNNDDHEEHKHDTTHEGHSHNHSHDHHGHSHNHSPTKNYENTPATKYLLEEIEMLKMEKNELLKAIKDFPKSKANEEAALVNGDAVEEMTDEKLRLMNAVPKPKSVTPSMATEEALEKLQERFRRTILEVAELTEEKNRLEHVVTMLQFETETIGEYITLYQNQRRLLKQKEHQRDLELKNLAGDRELMNRKLLQLNGLIEKFVLQHTDRNRIEIAKEATNLFENEDQVLIPCNENYKDVDFETLKKETAGKILEILSDIKTTNTKNYDSNIGVENSCPCCLGRLETV